VASDHLEQMIDVMQANSINRKTIDWTTFRHDVIAAARGAETIADTYDAVYLALGLLGDNHSVYYPSNGRAIQNSSIICNAPRISNVVFPEGVGYVRVLAFGGSESAAITYSSVIRAVLAHYDTTATGWIVDLRGNSGGNMWPMVAGIGPLLGDSV